MKPMGMKDFVTVLAAQATIIADAFAAIADAAAAEIPPAFTVLGTINNNGQAPSYISFPAGTNMGVFSIGQHVYSRASADAVDMDFDPGYFIVSSIDASPATVIRGASVSSVEWTAVAGHVAVSVP